jgi:hypothetical protein
VEDRLVFEQLTEERREEFWDADWGSDCDGEHHPAEPTPVIDIGDWFVYEERPEGFKGNPYPSFEIFCPACYEDRARQAVERALAELRDAEAFFERVKAAAEELKA